ncbi:Putative ATP-dependent RNA helicase DDX46 [Gryllus bimaculatus]|nr:Putative ATP-dependent RNA helicase DDX46 [Gryllus bimaculatus]
MVRSRDKRSRSRSQSTERKRSRRSRSRERTKSSRYRRSRSRDRDRDRERHRRSHSRDRKRGDGKRSSPSKSKSKFSRDRSKSKSPSKDKDKKDGKEEEAFDPASLDKEEEQKRLEAEMQKRRERIERWRAERKKKELEMTKKDLKGTLVPLFSPKYWLWQNPNVEFDYKVGLLDYIQLTKLDGVQEEVRRVNKLDNKKGEPKAGAAPATNNSGSGVVIMTGVAKKKADKRKGELIEQNQDGLEYSSEEEEEDLNVTAAGLANKQKKELAKVDHTNMEYPPFRKNFYVEVPEIARMTQEEVDAYKEVSSRDLIGIAKTGSGKTLAFLLPMLRHILDQPPLEDMDGPIALIMTPTRELCMQIGKECKKFTKSLGLRAVCVYGGTGISEQIAELKRGAEVIVCTPGRMIDLLAANSGRVTNLRRVTYVVLDEADRMFDMGFEPQVMRIIENIRPDRQTVMFSATFPRQMEALARRILTKPIEVQIGGRSVVCKEVEQHVVIIEEEQKFLKLLELLGHFQSQGSVIVFVDKQENADSLLKDLMKASYPCMSLHGGIDQFDRDSTIVDFKSGKVKLLVATSVAARGLDVKQAGNKGYAYTFLTPEQERYAGDIVRAFELAVVPVPEPLRILWDRYKAKQAAEGKKVHTGGGFSGKGFKFDEAEAQIANEKKKFQKAALGLQDSDDEDLEHDIDQQIENMLAPKRIVKEIKAPIGNIGPGASGGVLPPGLGPSTDKLELARRLASRINMAKNLGVEAKGATQQAAEAILKGAGSQPLITAKTVAEQLAAKLNTKLNYQPKEEDERAEEEPVETFRKYEEELEINDFPQQARWRVTSKEALAQISEYSEAGITVRGTFYPTGKQVPEGERKLYLAIESTNELAVSKAKIEITRLIKEELLKLQSSAHHLMNKARYKVV